MEILNLHKNTQETILLFRNLDKQGKYNFFKQIEQEVDFFYQDYYLTDEKKEELDRRTEELDSKKTNAISWKTVQNEIKQKYGI